MVRNTDDAVDDRHEPKGWPAMAADESVFKRLRFPHCPNGGSHRLGGEIIRADAVRATCLHPAYDEDRG